MKTEQQINDALKQPIDAGRVKKRQGAGSVQLSYIEAYDAIDTANHIFGFDGWSHTLQGIEYREIGERGLFYARVEVEAQIGNRTVRHGDIGVGLHKKQSQEEIEKAVKEAVSDGLKRCLRAFGDQFGNSLYDKYAPEHKGQQRAAMPTQAELNDYYTLRSEAIAFGIKSKSGAPLWEPDETTTAPALHEAQTALEKTIEKRRAALNETQDAPLAAA